jgi:hypothetical protein
VRALQVTAVCFDLAGELFAAGRTQLYHISAAGRVSEVAALDHLPGRVDALCAAPVAVTNPDLSSSAAGGSPSRPRAALWAMLSAPANALPARLRFFRQPRPAKDELAARPSSFAGRRSSADGIPPILPVEGTSRGELRRAGPAGEPPSSRPAAAAGAFYPAPPSPVLPYQQPPPQRRSAPAQQPPPPQQQEFASSAPGPQQPRQAAGPYFPDPDPRPPPGPPPPPPPAHAPPPSTARASARPGTLPGLLAGLGLEQYLADFEREDLTELALLEQMAADEADFKDKLREIGVAKMGHRELIAKAVRGGGASF